MRRVDVLAETLNRAALGDLAAEMPAEIVQALADTLERRFGTPQLPDANETAVVAVDRLKTASLLFDRVWSPPAQHDPAPEGIAFYGATDLEVCLQAILVTLQSDPEAVRTAAALLPDSPFVAAPSNSNRAISEALFRERRIIATPAYDSREKRDAEFKRGETTVLLAAIEDVAVVDEAQLSWAQVGDFRRDRSARAAYERFVRWANREMLGRSQAEVADEIQERLERYNWALRKHGIMTVLGAIESALDPKFVAGAAAAVGLLGFAAGGGVATTVGISLTLGKMAVTVARSMFDLASAKRGENSEIAFVHQMGRLRDTAG